MIGVRRHSNNPVTIAKRSQGARNDPSSLATPLLKASDTSLPRDLEQTRGALRPHVDMLPSQRYRCVVSSMSMGTVGANVVIEAADTPLNKFLRDYGRLRVVRESAQGVYEGGERRGLIDVLGWKL